MIPVLAVLAATATACFGSGGAAQTGGGAPAGRLTLTVSLLQPGCGFIGAMPRCTSASIHRSTLTCNPDSGTVPHPSAACGAIADYLRRGGGTHGLCFGLVGGPGSTSNLVGTYDHRPFRLRLQAGYSWCGAPRPVMRDFWILSGFPCSVVVIHDGGPGIPFPYSRWSRWAGCGSG